MRPSRSSVAVLLAGLSLAGAARAPAQGVTAEGAAFLLLPVGARAAALGQAQAAEGGTTEALFWNPAGLAGVPAAELGVHYYSTFFGTGTALAVAVPTKSLGTFSAGAYMVDYGDFELTLPPPGGVIGRVTARNVVLALSYAANLSLGFDAGITWKMVQFRVDCSGDCSNVPPALGTTQALDLGVQWHLSGSPVTLAAAIRHLGFKLQVNNQAQADELPARLVLGAAWTVVKPADGTDNFDVRVLLDLESNVARGALDPAPLVGIETGLRQVVRVRAGYAFVDGQARGPSLGLGIKVGRVAVDLARTFYTTDAIGEQEPVHLSLRVVL